MSLRALIAVLAAPGLVLCLAGSAASQSRTERYPELGLTVVRPAAWVAVPIPPGEASVALDWRAPGVEPARPRLRVVLLDRGQPSLATRAFVASEIAPADSEERHAGPRRFGARPVRLWYSRPGPEGLRLRGFVHGWEQPERTVLVWGECTEDEWVRQRGAFERAAERLELGAPRVDARERGRWQAHYARHGSSDPGRRVEERLRLPPGWTALDTEHYMLLTHAGEPFAAQAAQALETLRARLVRELPPGPGAGAAVGVVRLCADRDEYLAYGGRASTAGYFSPTYGELVLYAAGPAEQTRATLAHEAFHQYANDATSGAAPHAWFDEGSAEYYGALTTAPDAEAGGAPSTHRDTLRGALAEARLTPLAELLRLGRTTYYGNPALHYAEGWALVYFLREAPEARRHHRHAGLLDRYYGALRGAWAAELDRPLAAEGVEVALERARSRALESALEGVDVDALERSFRGWLERNLGRGVAPGTSSR